MNFYEFVVNSGIDPSKISFAGHSLGGMAAGYLAGVTGSQGMIFASGPQNIFVRDLGADVVLGPEPSTASYPVHLTTVGW